LNICVPVIVNDDLFCKNIIPLFILNDESIKVESDNKESITFLFELIIIGVNDSVLVNENEFRYKVHDEDIIISLFVWVPVNSKGPSPVIVIILSETVYPSPEEVNEIVVVNCIKIKEENNVIRNIYILLIIY
jgi:hypothetical protein